MTNLKKAFAELRQEVGVTPYPPGAAHPAEFYQETPNGAIIPARYLNFDLPENR